MKQDFDYKEVPHDYTHCLHAQCPRSANCLRFLVTQHAGPEVIRIQVINPAHVIGKEEKCSDFQPDVLACFAFGITHLFDKLPYSTAVKVRRLLFLNLKRNTFYRIQRKERLINPEEISLIREAFRMEGIKEEPVFDELIYKYDW